MMTATAITAAIVEVSARLDECGACRKSPSMTAPAQTERRSAAGSGGAERLP